MIDFKNYERVTKKDWKTEYEIGVCVQDGSAGECPVYNTGFKYIKRLAKLEDLIEQGKLVKKIEPKTTLTNREYLNNLSNEEFARAIAIKVALSQEPNFNQELKYTEIVNDIQIYFEEWLNDEYKE